MSKVSCEFDSASGMCSVKVDGIEVKDMESFHIDQYGESGDVEIRSAKYDKDGGVTITTRRWYYDKEKSEAVLYSENQEAVGNRSDVAKFLVSGKK
jgi:hypothetical protein